MKHQCTDAAEQAGASSSTSGGAPVNSGVPDDEDMDALVARVLGNSDPHICLGLHPAFSPLETCRKRYYQLAKKLHPDKTTHPRGVEAFRAVDAAWRTLQARLGPQ